MYRQAWALAFPDLAHLPPLVVLGHHLDDSDENVLDQLCKGHLTGALDSMLPLRRDYHGCTVLRPLLRTCRKADLYRLAHLHSLPYMYDSTPPWSVRGITRAILDMAGEGHVFQDLLSEVRCSAEVVDIEFRALVEQWSNKRVRELSCDQFKAVVVSLSDGMFDPSPQVLRHAQCLEKVRSSWAEARSALCSAKPKDWACVVGEVASPEGLVSGLYLFSIFVRQVVLRLSDTPLTRKAVGHLWSMVQSSSPGVVCGGLTEDVGCLVRSTVGGLRTLVLYSSRGGVPFKDVRNEILKLL
jgi:hypothetical protein